MQNFQSCTNKMVYGGDMTTQLFTNPELGEEFSDYLYLCFKVNRNIKENTELDIDSRFNNITHSLTLSEQTRFFRLHKKFHKLV